jgi:hypothetical protein
MIKFYNVIPAKVGYFLMKLNINVFVLEKIFIQKNINYVCHVIILVLNVKDQIIMNALLAVKKIIEK